uniref:Phage major capsid protein E n=1 Tax=Candidatus Kentrum sp. TC TaxID=2126339 RepID=A0A450YWA5_9GAMM|nr:MAG: Phage major capsid protein E [Candidatus Kentron sp. TC]
MPSVSELQMTYLADMFTPVTLTESILALQPPPAIIGDMGIFGEKGVKSPDVYLAKHMGHLRLVPDTPRNAPGVWTPPRDAIERALRTAHLAESRTISADDLSVNPSVIVGGEAEQQAAVINDAMEEMLKNLQATQEYHRAGALRGVVMDASGTELLNLFDEFQVSRHQKTFDFSNPDLNVRKDCIDIKRLIESELLNASVVIRGVHCFCGPDFFDALVDHPNVQKAYQGYLEAEEKRAGDLRDGFKYGGVVFQEYNATVSGKKFFPDNGAAFFPRADGVYMNFYAPADWVETVGELGVARYARGEAMKMGRGWEIEAQSNPLTLCMYPGALVEGTVS